MNFAWNIEHEQAFASEISNIFFMEIIEHCEHERTRTPVYFQLWFSFGSDSLMIFYLFKTKGYFK